MPGTDAVVSSVPAVGQSYAEAIQASPELWMRDLPGRDVIEQVQRTLALCHPDGLATTECVDAAGRPTLAVECGPVGVGCVPGICTSVGTVSAA